VAWRERKRRRGERKKGRIDHPIGARVISAFITSAHRSRKFCVVTFGASSKRGVLDVLDDEVQWSGISAFQRPCPIDG
jgi:hypothetical protein